VKIVTIVGARPQFVKAAPVSRALAAAGLDEVLIHTGQHYDPAMSQVFFDELGIPPPGRHLGIGSDAPSRQTGRMLAALSEALEAERPDWVVVYGDTTSTLAGALAAAQRRIPLAHVEAGLRSFNRSMPEELNRVLTDHAADLLLCPTDTAVANLAAEGVRRGVRMVGDPMIDATRMFAQHARTVSTLRADLGLAPGSYALATLHRPYTVDEPDVLRRALGALSALPLPVLFPVHPRSRARIDALEDVVLGPNVRLLSPVGYLDMLALEQDARIILTDSGGMQKEAYAFGVPCVTLRPETEWVETVAAGWNVLAGIDQDAIIEAVTRRAWPTTPPPPVFGDGHASEAIAACLASGVPVDAPIGGQRNRVEGRRSRARRRPRVTDQPSDAPRVLLCIPDLMAETRVLSALAVDGLSARAVGDAEWPSVILTTLEAAREGQSPDHPAVAVVDLTAAGAIAAIRAAVAAGLTTIAFGPHVDAAALEAARASGAARVLARGDFLQHAAQRVREAMGDAVHGAW